GGSERGGTRPVWARGHDRLRCVETDRAERLRRGRHRRLGVGGPGGDAARPLCRPAPPRRSRLEPRVGPLIGAALGCVFFFFLSFPSPRLASATTPDRCVRCKLAGPRERRNLAVDTGCA